MIILSVNIVVNTGSTGRIIEDIGLKILNKKWESYIAYGRNSGKSQSETIRIGSNRDIIFHGIKTRLLDKHGFGSRHATLKFIEYIKKLKPNIIHLHNIHGYYINIEILFNYLKTANIPIIWTLHDCWSFTGHCTHFDSIGCTKWEQKCFSCPQKNSYPGSWVLDKSKENYDIKMSLFNSVSNLTIVPVSNWLASVVRRSFMSNYRIKVINNGVSIDTFFPQANIDAIKNKYNIKSKYNLLGVATSWTENKGFNDFITLSLSLPKEYTIILVGLTTKQLKNIPKNIIGIPRTENIQELVQLYSAADIVLNLSFEESFGLTTVEGFACGTPSIVYNCTASPELITKETGLVVEKNNIIDLKNAIFEIISKGKDHYSSACRERAINYYNKDDRYEEYIQLYNKILNQQ